MSETIYNRHDESKGYRGHLFRASRGLQSAELNEIQTNLLYRLRDIGDVLFKDGSVLSGSQPILSDTGDLRLFDSMVYIRGQVYPVAGTVIQVPMLGTGVVGVYFKTSIVTELEDASLRDPAEGTRNYDEPGAARLKVTLTWGVPNVVDAGDFFPVHTVQDGDLLRTAPPPELDGVLQLVAKYDMNSNGHYVVDGLETRVLSEDAGVQVLSISEGNCHVNGFEIRKNTATRKTFEAAPDTDTIVSEPHVFTDSGNGTAVITLNKGPIAAVTRVNVTKRTTQTITHGSFTGAVDQLPDPSILSIVSVKQGGTTYNTPADFIFTNNNLDWSPGGAEPAPGSTYTVVYDHVVQVAPLEVDTDTIKVGTALNGTTIYVDYSWKVPRVDRVVINEDGLLSVVKGQPSKYVPRAPDVPRGSLGLATLTQTWRGAPLVTNNGVKVTPMSELAYMKQQIDDLYDLVAQERLRNQANASDPAAKKGVFVDPFNDDTQRDQGIDQTAAVFGGFLMLGIEATISTMSTGKLKEAELLPYELEVVLEQSLTTGAMKINPYMAFEPIPAKMRLDQPVDRFTEVRTRWSSPVTQRVWWWQWSGVGSVTQETSRTTHEAEYLRVIDVNIEASGFGAGEQVQSATFDGVPVTLVPIV